ncbi:MULTISPECIES: hypothetical protein [unclassified Tolypothrix]|nr:MULTISPECIES: hypothetical protein [unclassified Tolypothrix]EKE97379.1 tRNA-specific adenosine deaminase [Tolypothrix sp. PCC 7601]UYD24333.1 hypothetical protein HGR01_23050 [Tolypothrix sp. PCC 7712]UYD33433.1 hypothetical protein HG267_31625 [Tolypothrix sp. PCC 7601]
MGTGDWGLGDIPITHYSLLITHYPCPMPNAPCPLTIDILMLWLVF